MNSFLQLFNIVCTNVSKCSTRTHWCSSKRDASYKVASKVRSFDEIPREKGIRSSFLGLVLDGGPRYLHIHCDKLHKKLGPIYRDKLGPRDFVFISDADSMRKVSANEGQYPKHNIPEAWLVFNEVHKVKRGLFFQSGEDWAQLRKPFNKVLLSNIDKINQFDSSINKITQDIFEQWHKQSSKKVIVDNLKMELCKWSIEATGVMLFGSRMGCIRKGRNFNSKAEDLVDCVARMFDETSRFQMIPAKLAHKLGLKTWKRFEGASFEMLALAEELTRLNINKCLDSKQKNCSPFLVKDLLTYLSTEDVIRSVIDLIIAAADTTSNSLQWIMYSLGKHQHIQSKLRGELENETNNFFLTASQTDNSSYIKWLIKDIMRLYPTAPFLARTLDTDIELNGYNIPKGNTIIFSLYTSGRSEQYFNKPHEILPERWQSREQKDGCPISPNYTLRHPFATLPFGVGARFCIGKRLAELQMRLLVTAFVKNFHITIPKSQENLGINLNMILAPEEPIKLILESKISNLYSFNESNLM